MEEIGDIAAKEWSLEQALERMKKEWAPLELVLTPWRDTGTYVLKGGPLEEAQILLDDHLVKTQASPATRLRRTLSTLHKHTKIVDRWFEERV